MKKVRSINISFGRDMYCLVSMLLFTISQLPFFWDIFPSITIIVVMLPWGCILLLCDLLYERRLFQMKHAWMLIAFLMLFGLSMLVNGHVSDNIYRFLFALICMLVLCVPDKPVSMHKKYKMIFAFFAITIVPTTILSAMSIWAQVAQSGFFVEGIWFGYAVDNTRLSGFFGALHSAALLSPMAVIMLVICWVTIEKITNNMRIIKAVRASIPIMILINFTMLILTDYRNRLLFVLVFGLLYSFIALLQYFSVKLSSIAKSCLAAALIAGIITGAAYLTVAPIRTGVKLVQGALNKEIETGVNETDGTNETGELSTLGRDEGVRAHTVSVRYRLWRYGFELIKKHPVLGVTPDEFSKKAMELIDNEPREELIHHYSVLGINPDEFPESRKGGVNYERLINKILTEYANTFKGGGTHNAYIQLAVTNGVPALILMLLFLLLFAIRSAKILFTSIHSEHYLAAGGILAFCAGIVFYNLFESHICHFDRYSTVLLWSCLGFSATLLGDLDNSQKEKVERLLSGVSDKLFKRY